MFLKSFWGGLATLELTCAELDVDSLRLRVAFIAQKGTGTHASIQSTMFLSDIHIVKVH